MGSRQGKSAVTPRGWTVAGSHPADYEFPVDRNTARTGKGSACIRSTARKAKGFGTLMQTFRADAYLGERVRMSGYLKSRDVSEWAALWMRIDGSRGQRLGFDNMHDGGPDRSVKGTTDWTECQIVLDVPPNSFAIAFGVLLAGKGQIWVDDFRFEVVGDDVPVTDQEPRALPEAPTNLGFEE